MPKPYRTESKKLNAQKGDGWEPKNDAERSMDRQFRKLTRSERVERGIEFVIEDGLSVSAAARKVGVSRQQLSTRVNERRRWLVEQQERAEAARHERVAEAQGQKLAADEVISVSRRVPSFREFNRIYFGTEHCPDCDKHHEPPEFHNEMMDILEDRSKRTVLFNLPPYHAKSTYCTFKSTLYELVRDPESRTAIISAGGDLAEAFIHQIKEHLVDESLYEGCAGNLIEDWGPFYNPGSWSASEFRILGKSGAQKEPSVSTYGFGRKIYGRRFDRMIFDDVADFENQNTPEAIDKMYRKIWQEYVNRIGKNGRLLFVGTRVAPADIYYRLANEVGEQLTVYRRPAILDEIDGITLWQDHLDLEGIRLKSAGMTPEQFQLVYQNVEAGGFSSSFPQDVLDMSHDMERYIGHYDPTWSLVAGVDPAGAGAQSGYTAMVLMGVDLVSGRRHLIDVVNQRALPAPDLMNQIYDWAERYPLRELRVEINGLQRQLFQYNVELNQRMVSKGVRIVPHHTGKNKWDPNFGVESMAPLYHQGMVSTPWQDIGTRTRFKQLEDELVVFPTEPTDLVMAMWFAELGCREMLDRHKIPSFDPRFKLPHRLASKRKIVNFGNGTARQPTRRDFTTDLHGTMDPEVQQSLVNIAPGVGVPS